MFVVMRIENDYFSINKIHKSLDVNFISIKKHEMDFLQLFYFQVREPLILFMFNEWSLSFLFSRKGIIKYQIADSKGRKGII